MVTRVVFGLMLLAVPLSLALKVTAQRRALGRSPVVLGRSSDSVWGCWFERLSPFGLLFWPGVWLWVALGRAPVSGDPARAVGLMVIAGGGALTVASMFLMGRAWRIGIDPENRTELAENGPYRWVRHPIYSGFLVLLIGNVLVLPHLAIDVAALVTAVGILYQSQREEAHLHRTFGERYARYCARTGRFAPRLWSRD